jgi:hypothetical protein
MERRAEEESGRSSSAELSIVDAVKAIAAFNARADLSNEQQLLLFLQSWWSRTYNRPLKDPILQTYTLEELLYEFYDRVERDKARKEQSEEDDDRIELEKEKADLDWAQIEEMKEMEEDKKRQSAKASPKQDEPAPADPTKDPANVKWMEEQLHLAKQQFGESFGEDVEVKFDE